RPKISSRRAETATTAGIGTVSVSPSCTQGSPAEVRPGACARPAAGSAAPAGLAASVDGPFGSGIDRGDLVGVLLRYHVALAFHRRCDLAGLSAPVTREDAKLPDRLGARHRLVGLVDRLLDRRPHRGILPHVGNGGALRQAVGGQPRGPGVLV